MTTKRMMVMGFLALCVVAGLPRASAQAAGRDRDNNDYCREYTRTVYIGNRQQDAYGTACLQPNGDWKIVDEDDSRRVGQTLRYDNVVTNYQPVYQPRYRTAPQQTRVIFISDNDHRAYRGHKQHYRYDRGRHGDNYGAHNNWRPDRGDYR